MAGVVVVTLVALVAFDVAAVATMRRYLLAQTDNNLQVALTLTTPRLNGILSDAWPSGEDRSVVPAPAELTSPDPGFWRSPARSTSPSCRPGASQVTLQVAANAGPGGYSGPCRPARPRSPPSPARIPWSVPTGAPQIRVQSLRVSGGALVAGTSLDQVTETIDQVEVIVTFGSIAVVLLIGLGVFVVLRRGLRPIEAMAGQADRITAGDLTDRVTPHSPAKRGGQARRGPERHAGPDRGRRARA